MTISARLREHLRYDIAPRDAARFVVTYRESVYAMHIDLHWQAALFRLPYAREVALEGSGDVRRLVATVDADGLTDARYAEMAGIVERTFSQLMGA